MLGVLTWPGRFGAGEVVALGRRPEVRLAAARLACTAISASAVVEVLRRIVAVDVYCCGGEGLVAELLRAPELRALRVIITSPSSAWRSVPPAVPTVITSLGRTSWMICSMNRCYRHRRVPGAGRHPVLVEVQLRLDAQHRREPMRVG